MSSEFAAYVMLIVSLFWLWKNINSAEREKLSIHAAQPCHDECMKLNKWIENIITMIVNFTAAALVYGIWRNSNYQSVGGRMHTQFDSVFSYIFTDALMKGHLKLHTCFNKKRERELCSSISNQNTLYSVGGNQIGVLTGQLQAIIISWRGWKTVTCLKRHCDTGIIHSLDIREVVISQQKESGLPLTGAISSHE